VSVLEVSASSQRLVPSSLDEVKIISFDLDDTLWHCAPAILKAEAALFRWHEQFTPAILDVHTPTSLQDYRAAMRLKYPELQTCVTSMRLAGLRSLLNDFHYPEALADEAFDVFYRARSEVELYEGALDMLSVLRKHYRLAAITNGNANLDLVGIAEHFDIVLAADLTLAPKPEPDMFERCLQHFGISGQALLHIGDNPVADVTGGHNARVQTLWFNQYNDPWPQDLHPPHFQAQTLSEIVQLLAR
jgi:putative hydrolase of the HAD superfamily